MLKSITVQSLIGSHDLKFYLKCLISLLEFSDQKINLLLHETDNFSIDNEEILHDSLNGYSFKTIKSTSSLEKTLDSLQKYPNCQKFRQNSLWGIEFFDPIFSCPNDPFSLYIDADILFIRPFKGLFNTDVIKNGAIFMRDTSWDAYSIRPWHLFGLKKKPNIVKGITTAFVCWDKKAIDWEYLEWFLGQINLHKIPEWVMPTAQAGLASLCESKTVHHSQLLNMYPNAQLKNNTFGLHLLGSYRKEWLTKINLFDYSNNPKDICAQFDKCEKRNFLFYGFNQTKRWLNTRLNWWPV